MRALIELFRLPSAKTLAQRQIESPSASGSSTWLLPSIANHDAVSHRCRASTESEES